MSTITSTIRFGWHEIKERYQATCRSCGKQYQRTTSTGYNDTASAEYRAEARAKLKADAERYSKEPITCNACRKASIAEPAPVVLVCPAALEEIARIEAEQAALDARKQVIERKIYRHNGRLFLHAGETYVQSGCSFGWDGDCFTIHGYRISKVRPWETTDAQVQAPITEITYLDDTIDNRKAKGIPA